MPKTTLKDRTSQLVAAFCAGDDRAFGELYDLYVHILYNYGCRLTGNHELLKDCIHDVFVRVYCKRGDQQAIKNFGSYLIIALKNKLLDEFRRQTFVSEISVEECFSRPTADDTEGNYLEKEHEQLQQLMVSHLMENLTRRQRQAITLYYIEQRKYEEICKIMEMNYHSVRNLMHRGMIKLRQAANLV